MAKHIVVAHRSDLGRLFQSVTHKFHTLDDANSELNGKEVLTTTVDLGDIHIDGVHNHGTFGTFTSAEDLKPLDDDPNAEPTPVNRVFLMTKNQNAVLVMIEEALTAHSGKKIEVAGNTVEFVTGDDL